MTVQIEKKSLDDINGTDKTEVRPSTSFVCFFIFYFLFFFFSSVFLWRTLYGGIMFSSH